ncbi:MAG: hypothetical protein ACW99J_16465 [Candidatus Thorarchaeota archaeon]|jgi:hypothetical protein
MTESEIHKVRPSSWRVGGAIAFAIFVLPFSISGRHDHLTLAAGLWLFITTPTASELFILGSEVWSFEVIMFDVFPQFLFVYQMMRLYEGKTTGRRAFLMWFIGVSNLLLTFVMNSLPALWDPYWPYAFNPVVIPSSLLVAVLLVHFYPPPRETIWWKRA